MRRALTLVLGVVVIGAGCNSAPDFVERSAPPNTIDVPLDRLVDQYTKAICEARAECFGPFSNRWAGSTGFGGGCEETYRPYVKLSVEQYLKPAIARGAVLYDPTAAGAYIQSLPATYCTPGKSDDRVAVELGSAIAPLLSVGDSCYWSQECGASLYCDYAQGCPGKCAVQKASGADCSSDIECLRGYSCASKKCAPKRAQGQPCGGNLPACQHPQLCAEVIGNGLCETPVSLARSQNGEQCLPLSDVGQCVAGFGCLSDDPNNPLLMHCRPLGPTGSDCSILSTLDGCADGFYCQPPSMGTNGVCQPTPGVGQPCAIDALKNQLCSAGLLCNAQGVCAHPRALGEPCGGEGECIGGTCKGGKCQRAQDTCYPP
jgi:hypothetical protein